MISLGVGPSTPPGVAPKPCYSCQTLRRRGRLIARRRVAATGSIVAGLLVGEPLAWISIALARGVTAGNTASFGLVRVIEVALALSLAMLIQRRASPRGMARP